MDAAGDTSMHEVYAPRCAERQIAACNFFCREASPAPVTRRYSGWQRVQIITNLPEMHGALDTIDAPAGTERLVVTGRDPQGADRFKRIGPGAIVA
jgi:hypothetical protein